MRNLLARFNRAVIGNVSKQLALLNVSSDPKTGKSGFVGSALPQLMMKSMSTQSDCLDIMVIGDSNAGFSESTTDYGHTAGIANAVLSQTSTKLYASPLLAGSLSSGSANRVGNMLTTGISLNWCGDNQAGLIGSVRTLVQAAAAPVADAASLQTYLNYNSSLLPKQIGFEWYGAFVASGVSYTNAAANNNCIIVDTTSSLNVAGAGMQHRVVYGKFTTTGGQFRNGWWSNFTSAFDSYRSTSGGISVDVLPWNFNAPNPVFSYRVSWDGINDATKATAGPFACIWQSVIRTGFIGYSITNFIYDGGKTTAQLADRIEGCGKLLDTFVSELRNRQIASGGTGNLLVYINSGINDGGVASSYAPSIARMVNRIKDAWRSGGGVSSKLSFVICPTHPNTTGSWSTDRAAFMLAANSYAASTNGVCAYDISSAYTAAQLLSLSYYSSGGQAHLTNTGYLKINEAMCASLVA